MTMPDPVGVSGPGALSQRVDRQPLRAPTGLPYGEAGALMAAQRSAPLPEAPRPSPVNITGLDAESARPGQPVTAGAPAGPGPGPEVLSTATGRPAAGGPISQAIARAAASDPTGQLAELLVIAQQKGM
jgi:hypothetical protein